MHEAISHKKGVCHAGFISEEEARVYEKEFHAGRAIVTVHAGQRVPEARRILNLHGAKNVQNEPTDPLHPVSMVLAPRYP